MIESPCPKLNRVKYAAMLDLTTAPAVAKELSRPTRVPIDVATVS
jgi:hypothetical protein